jgi:two-component system chemotaxis sensor kinase CheA
MSFLDETVREILVESVENLEQLERELLALEEGTSDPDTINRIFRIVHTIKGTCGFFGFSKLEKVSHVGENLLDSLRSGKVQVSNANITALLGLCDTLKEIVLNIASSGEEGSGDYLELVSLLTDLNTPTEATPCHRPSDSPSKEVKEPVQSGKPQPEEDLDAVFEATRVE